MMAGGLPVLASNIPGLKEVIPDQMLLVDPFNVFTFSELILKLIDNKKLYQEIQEKALKKADYFSINKMALSYYHEYKKV
jgi:glycosyltransferase involved in cell wall biosynthesis